MLVKAIEMGYYDHRRIKAGEVFEMNEKALYKHAIDEKGEVIRDAKGKPQIMKDKEGNPVLPRWVIPADQKIRQRGSEVHIPGMKISRGRKNAAGYAKSAEGAAVDVPVQDDGDVI